MKKLLLALGFSSLSLISMSSIAAYNAGYGYVTSVTVDKSGNCSFDFFFKETNGAKRKTVWGCASSGGENMFLLAESAQNSSKEIQISVSNLDDGAFELHSISMH